MEHFAELCIRHPKKVTRLLQSYAIGGKQIDPGELRLAFADLGVSASFDSLAVVARAVVAASISEAHAVDCELLVKDLVRKFKRSREELRILQSVATSKPFVRNSKTLIGSLREKDLTRAGLLTRSTFLECLRQVVTLSTDQEDDLVRPFLNYSGEVNYVLFLAVVTPKHKVELNPTASATARDVFDLLVVLRDVVIHAKQCGVSPLESFEFFDADGDGVISCSEFRRGLESLGLFLTELEAQAVCGLFERRASLEQSKAAYRGISYVEFLCFVDNDYALNSEGPESNKTGVPRIPALSSGLQGQPFVAGVTVKLNSKQKRASTVLRQLCNGKTLRSRTCAGMCHQLRVEERVSSVDRYKTHALVLQPHIGKIKVVRPERCTVSPRNVIPAKLAFQRKQNRHLGYLSETGLHDQVKTVKGKGRNRSTMILSKYKRVFKQSTSVVELLQQCKHVCELERRKSLLSEAREVLSCALQLASETVLGSVIRNTESAIEKEKYAKNLISKVSIPHRVVVVQMITIALNLASIEKELGLIDSAAQFQSLAETLLNAIPENWSSYEAEVLSRGCFFMSEPQCSISCTFYSGLKSPTQIAEHLWKCFTRFDGEVHFHVGSLKCSKTEADLLLEVDALLAGRACSWFDLVRALSKDATYSDHLHSLKSSFHGLEILVLDALYQRAALKSKAPKLVSTKTLISEVLKDSSLRRFLDRDRLCRRLCEEANCLKSHAEGQENEIQLCFEQFLGAAAAALNSFNLEFLRVAVGLCRQGVVNQPRTGKFGPVKGLPSTQSNHIAAGSEILSTINEDLNTLTGSDTLHPIFYSFYLEMSRHMLALYSTRTSRHHQRTRKRAEEYVFSVEGRANVRRIVNAMTTASSSTIEKRKAEIAASEAVKSRFLANLRAKRVASATSPWLEAERCALKAVTVAECHWGHDSKRAAQAQIELGNFYKCSKDVQEARKCCDAYFKAMHILEQDKFAQQIEVSVLAVKLAEQLAASKDPSNSALYYEIGAACAENSFRIEGNTDMLHRAVVLFRKAFLKYCCCGSSHKRQAKGISQKLVGLQRELTGTDSLDYVEALLWSFETDVELHGVAATKLQLRQARKTLENLPGQFQRKQKLNQRISCLVSLDKGRNQLAQLAESLYYE